VNNKYREFREKAPSAYPLYDKEEKVKRGRIKWSKARKADGL